MSPLTDPSEELTGDKHAVEIAELRTRLDAVTSELQQVYQLLESVDKARREEISSTYGMLKDVDSQRVFVTQNLNTALEELGPARFNSNHYLKLKAEQRLIELDFPVTVKRRDFRNSRHMRRLIDSFESGRSDLQQLLNSFAQFAPQFRNIEAHTVDGQANEPNWMNDWLPGLDGISLYAFTALQKPKIYFEVGSGNSTRFVRRAIKDFKLETRIISIDPFPRADIDEICDEVHRVGIESFDLDQMDRLTGGDIVFIDNSHRSFQNSDVTVFFMEMLGRLPKGCLYGLHDIFLPDDYPEGWEARYYNEHFLLASYLFGGADGDRVILPAAYLSNDSSWLGAMNSFWSGIGLPEVRKHGGGFWLRKA